MHDSKLRHESWQESKTLQECINDQSYASCIQYYFFNYYWTTQQKNNNSVI